MAVKTSAKLITLDADYDFETQGFITCQTNLAIHQLVALLNRAAHFDLHRIDQSDVSLAPLLMSDFQRDNNHMGVSDISSVSSLPIYFYHDDTAKLSYHLIDLLYYKDLPADIRQMLRRSDKVLNISGMGAIDKQSKVFQWLISKQGKIEAYDYLAQQEQRALDELSSNLIDINYFDFSNPEVPQSSQWASYKPLSSKASKAVDSLRRFFGELLETIEQCHYNISRSGRTSLISD